MEYRSVECSYRVGLVYKKVQSELQIQLLSKNFDLLSVVYVHILSPKEPLNLKTNAIIPWLRHGS